MGACIHIVQIHVIKLIQVIQAKDSKGNKQYKYSETKCVPDNAGATGTPDLCMMAN